MKQDWAGWRAWKVRQGTLQSPTYKAALQLTPRHSWLPLSILPFFLSFATSHGRRDESHIGKRTLSLTGGEKHRVWKQYPEKKRSRNEIKRHCLPHHTLQEWGIREQIKTQLQFAPGWTNSLLSAAGKRSMGFKESWGMKPIHTHTES